MSATEEIVRIVRQHLPSTQAIYLLGSFGTPYERPESDVDLAVLLPYPDSKERGSLVGGECHLALIDALRRPVDLINAREATTVMRKEIVATGRILYEREGQHEDVIEFEALTLSFYQRLNIERREILEDFRASGGADDA